MTTTIPLRVLIDAEQALRICKDLPSTESLGDKWTSVMHAWAALATYTNHAVAAQKVEVTA